MFELISGSTWLFDCVGVLKIAYKRLFENSEHWKQTIITQNCTMTRADFVIERCSLKNLHVTKNLEQSISEYNECHVPGDSFIIERQSCDSPGGGPRTVIIGMFAVFTTSAPFIWNNIWGNIYQPWAIEAYFCFLFVVHHWHGTCQDMMIFLYSLGNNVTVMLQFHVMF